MAAPTIQRGKFLYYISFDHVLPILFSWLLFLAFMNTVSPTTIISSLPGFDGPLPFQLETGYVGIGDLNEDQLFYYFIQSESNPREDPLLLWLPGGPGCSAFNGLVFEIGPLLFKNLEYNGRVPPLELNPHSWTKVSSVIFVDQPVGTGFSYTVGGGDRQITDMGSVKEAQEFLLKVRGKFLGIAVTQPTKPVLKWLINHPQFLSNPLYIGGNSYAGKLVPILVDEIANDNDAGQEPRLNIQGYLVGNPMTDDRILKSSRIPFAHGMALISDEIYESARKNCQGAYSEASNPECARDLDRIIALFSGIYVYNILEDNCPLSFPKPYELLGERRSVEDVSQEFTLPPSLPAYGCREYGHLLLTYWANFEYVKKALNIKKGTIKEWVRCSNNLHYTADIMSSVKYHLNVATRGYRGLVYSGDHDMLAPFVGTQAWIRSLNFSIIDDWRAWSVTGQVAGFTRTYSNNLTFATVKGAGHTAPEYKPKECLAMYTRWISHSPL